MQTIEKEQLLGHSSAVVDSKSRWADWQLLAVAGCMLVLFAPVLMRLVAQWWSDPDYSHGFFVPFFSAYLIWRRRGSLAKLNVKPTWWGMLLVLGSVGLLFLGSLGAELFLTRVGLVGTIAGVVLFFYGFATLRALLFPLGFLFLMIPLPAIIYNEITFPLQLLASRLAAGSLQQLHLFPILREGNLLILPNYTLEVVEACSGIRSLMSLMALILAYGYLAENSRWIRLLLALLVFPIAVLGNALRVMVTAALTYKYGPEVGEGALHPFYGIGVFLVAMLVIVGIHTAINAMRRHAGRLENV